jgi:hypothetical protein
VLPRGKGENELVSLKLVSLIQQLTTDRILFKVTRKGDERVETTLASSQENSESLPGHWVGFVCSTGKV